MLTTAPLWITTSSRRASASKSSRSSREGLAQIPGYRHDALRVLRLPETVPLQVVADRANGVGVRASARADEAMDLGLRPR